MRQALKRANILFFSGFGCVLLACLIGEAREDSALLCLLLVLAGVALMIGGWTHGKIRCVCPRCGRSLYESGFRMPGKIPNYCPQCGQEL